jgi:hypothetical protein
MANGVARESTLILGHLSATLCHRPKKKPFLFIGNWELGALVVFSITLWVQDLSWGGTYPASTVGAASAAWVGHEERSTLDD